MAFRGLKRTCLKGISIKIISLKEEISSTFKLGNSNQTLRSKPAEMIHFSFKKFNKIFLHAFCAWFTLLKSVWLKNLFDRKIWERLHLSLSLKGRLHFSFMEVENFLSIKRLLHHYFFQLVWLKTSNIREYEINLEDFWQFSDSW